MSTMRYLVTTPAELQNQTEPLPSRRSTESEEVPPILQTANDLVEAARIASDCAGICLYWFDRAGNVLVPIAATARLKDVLIPVIHPGQSLTGISYLSQQPLYVERNYRQSEFAHPYTNTVSITVEAAFSIPLRLGNTTLGILTGYATHECEFDDARKAAIEAVAAEVVPAFGMLGTLLVQAQVSRAEYALVSTLIREYASDDDFEATCSRIGNVAMCLLGADYTVVSRIEKNLSYSFHGALATRSDLWRETMPTGSPRVRGFEERLAAGEIVVADIDDISAAASAFAQSRDEDARTVMLIPIMIHHRHAGTLILGWRIDVSISDRFRHLAETLAGHAAIVIAESQRYDLYAAPNILDIRREEDEVARKLVEAIATAKLHLEYQPIYDAHTGEIAMVEALCRWPDGPAGYDRPDRFIVLAEERGLINALTEYVIDLAARDWRRIRGSSPATLAVNVSMHSFESDGFSERTLAQIARYDIAPHRFAVELTETAQLPDRKHAVTAIRKLAAAGVRVSIDDFGEGYAALSYLKTFRASTLKIDRRYVTNIADDAYDYSIVRSVTQLAHSLGVSVVAEGIETREALEIIKHLGCDMMQGYALARPMPINRLAEILT